MKARLLCVLILTVIAFGYPLVNEDANNECSALEGRLIAASADARDPAMMTFLNSVQSSVSNGSVERSVLKQQHPDAPAAVSCGLTYWRMLLDPAGAQRALVPATRVNPAAEEQRRALDQATEYERAMRALTTPAEASAPAAAAPPDYKQGVRRDMNRLIDNTR